MKVSAYRLLVPIGLAMFALTMLLMPISAQQGHNPAVPDSPEASPVASGAGWTIGEMTPLEVEGQPVSISPDGQWLAGVKGRDEVCLWAVSDLAETCGGQVRGIDPDSFAWAPDSSAVAFSVSAYQYFYDGDIFVFELADGQIHNVTDDGIDTNDFSIVGDSAKPTPIDVMPAWTPDSTAIVFSRTVFEDRDEIPNEVMRIPRAGGEPETLLSLPGLPASIFTPMKVLSDGSILYTVGFSKVEEPINGIWRLMPDGETTQLIEGNGGSEYPVPLISSVWEGDGEFAISGYSMAKLNEGVSDAAFIWRSADGEVLPLEATTGDDLARVYGSAIAPDGQTVVQITSDVYRGLVVEVVGPAASSSEPLPEFDGEGGSGARSSYQLPVLAANGTVFVPSLGSTAPVLVTLVPAGEATPVPTGEATPVAPCSCTPPAKG